MKLVSNPMKLSVTPVEVRMAPPTLGQHTDEVLRDRLGLCAEQITALRQKHAI
jgi:formyl-CoA transferase